jgi:uncharacterized protein YkwD
MLIAAALATVVVSVAAPATANAGQRKQMVRAINSARSWSNHQSVDFSRRLSRACAAWARNLMNRKVLSHASLHDGQGEIIEWHSGAGAQIGQTVREWLASPEHKHVILGRFTRAGAAKAVGYMNGERSTIWVVRFAR